MRKTRLEEMGKLLALALSLAIQGAFAATPKPNVIAIILDDAGWRDVGYNGGSIETPVIDRLAGEGVRLNRFYAYSTCTPSRAAFFSGKPPSRMGIVYPIQHDDRYGIPSEVDTLPEAFQKSGYRTALLGKWHLGMQEEFAPSAHGFDYHYGMRGGWADQYTRENPKTGYDWYRNDELVEPEPGHTTDLLTREALRYLADSGEQPYFLCLSFTAPHVPIQVDPKWSEPYRGKFDTATRAGYAGMMAQVDDSIGQVVRVLEERRQLENTLIVVFSDNGPSEPGKKWYVPEAFFHTNFYGNDGAYGDTGPLRGWKATPYEGGVRVPAFFYWKGRLGAEKWEKPVVVEDLYRTIANLAGLDIGESKSVEGRDIFAQSSKEAPTFYWRTPNNLALLRDGWKLIVHGKSPIEDGLKQELYRLETDLSESDDCSTSHPEKMVELISILQAEYEKDPPAFVNPILIGK